ncbi:hypothetical protein PG996_002995 [Apiospora saccharicola]|uniref:Uncharacterized protein n=1 Tax=Apiospora saccharicola TaxID=335842 RepID=A0ABR1W005_9PEZI
MEVDSDDESMARGHAPDVADDEQSDAGRGVVVQAPKRRRLYENDKSTKHHTQPGNEKLWLHTDIFTNDKLATRYLGFTDVWQLKRAIHSPRATHALRVVKPFLDKSSSALQLYKLYQEWRGFDNDGAFRDAYRVDESVVIDYVKTGEFRHPSNATINANSMVGPWCQALVWAWEFLSEPAGVPDPVWKNDKGQMETYPGSFEKLVTTDEMEGVLAEIPWTEAVRPKLIHYPQANESEFEKYCRVLAFVRRCDRFLSPRNYPTRIGKPFQRQLNKWEKSHGGRNASLDEKRRLMLDGVIHDPLPSYVMEEEGPVWMRKQTEGPEIPSTYDFAEIMRRPMPQQIVDYLLIPTHLAILCKREFQETISNNEYPSEGTLPQHRMVTKASYGNIDLSKFEGFDEWRDFLRIMLGFTDCEPPRQILSILLYNRELDCPGEADVDKTDGDSYEILYLEGYDKVDPSEVWEEHKRILTNERVIRKTLIISHYELVRRDYLDHHLESIRYRYMEIGLPAQSLYLPEGRAVLSVQEPANAKANASSTAVATDVHGQPGSTEFAAHEGPLGL